MPRIPDELWKCPNCGAGYDDGDGLTGPDYTTYEEYKEAYPDSEETPEEFGWCYCEKCGWEGHVTEVYEAAQKKAGRRKCPCCDGTGWVEEAK